MNSFSLAELKNMSVPDAKAYIIKYFIPLNNGNHAFLNSQGVYEIMPHDIVTKVYINRFPKHLKPFYMNEYDKIMTPVYKLNKPPIYDDKLNLCTQLPQPKKFESLPEQDKKYATIFLSYIKEVLCSNKEDSYEHLTKWIANVCKGNKNDSCVVLKTSSEGVGKSTLPQMIIKHMLPKGLTLETGSEPLKNKFNSILGGRIFVSFEELESLSVGEWMSMSSVLKRQITSNMITLESKGTNSYDADNLNNYMLLSNHDIQDEGRRFFVLDISTHRKGQLSLENRKYWSNIYENCFNDNVGYALYCFFREINTDKFNPQAFPETKSKLSSISKRLDNVYKFIKYKYVLKNKEINLTIDELLENYKEYCATEQMIKPLGKIGFNEKMKDAGFNYVQKKKNSKQYNYYIISQKKLLETATKNQWIHELDEFDTPFKIESMEYFEEPISTSKMDYDNMIEENIKDKKTIKELMEKIEKLEKEKNNDEIIKQLDDELDMFEETKQIEISDKEIKKEKKEKKKKKKDKCDIVKPDEVKQEITLSGETFSTKDIEEELTLDDIEAMLNEDVEPVAEVKKSKKPKKSKKNHT